MTTIYTVGTTKDIKLDDGTIRRYIAVDGGFIDNLRPALYNAIYTARLANRDSAEKLINSRIVGKHCESGDVIVDAIDLPADIQPGDLIAVPVTGAYGYSMANNYNQLGRPAVVVVENSAAGIMFRRENPADFQGLEQKLDMRPLSHKE
jgi:diaminopimelate decarboxylase